MKYLFLIIRHIFPRKRWQIIQQFPVFERASDEIPYKHKMILRDQFGNIKVKST